MSALTIPIAIQLLLSNIIVFVDNLMIASLGTDAIAAVGVASQVFFLMIIFTFGVSSSATLLMSQFIGNEDTENFQRTVAVANIIAICIGMMFFVGLITAAPFIVRLYSPVQEVQLLASGYLRIVCFSYILRAILFILHAALRTTGKQSIPMYGAILSVVLNIILNRIFIFGFWGIPAMGVHGAALATLISISVEFCYNIARSMYIGSIALIPLRIYSTIRKAFVKRYIFIALPVIINEIGWGLGQTMYAVIFGHISVAALATYHICQSLFRMVTIILFAGAHACNIVLGKNIGAGRYKRVYSYVRRSLIYLPIITCFFALLLLLIGFIAAPWYGLEGGEALLFRNMLIVLACTCTIEIMNMYIIVGILRAGADTFFGMLAEIITLWCIGLPLAALAAFVFHLSADIVILAMMLENGVKLLAGLLRLQKKAWIKRISA